MEKVVVQKVIGGAAIVNEDKILIVQRAADEKILPNIWEFPSGKKEPLEKIEDAAIREAKEETGLDIKLIKPIYVFNFGWENEEEVRDATEIVFLASTEENPQVKISSEHQNFAWISKDETENYNMSADTKAAIRIALS